MNFEALCSWPTSLPDAVLLGAVGIGLRKVQRTFVVVCRCGKCHEALNDVPPYTSTNFPAPAVVWIGRTTSEW